MKEKILKKKDTINKELKSKIIELEIEHNVKILGIPDEIGIYVDIDTI